MYSNKLKNILSQENGKKIVKKNIIYSKCSF